jgi:hypothetical protein
MISVLRLLLAGASSMNTAPLWPLQVTFHTGTLRGAGTDAAVWFELLDDAGATTGPVRTPAGAGAFQRGAADSFPLELPRLGRLARLAVWHDGCSEGSAWYLHHVGVQRGHGAGGGSPDQVGPG